MVLIALTGGIASGKSTVASYLAERGAHVVDADKLTRELQEPGQAAFSEILDYFGDSVLDSSGRLNRKALANIIFSDPSKREVLESIIHPKVQIESERIFRESFSKDPDRLVVYDVPLLAESARETVWDAILVTHAPSAQRIERLVNNRGMSRSDAQARVNAQSSDSVRAKIADYLIDTSGSIASVYEQVDEILKELA